MSAFVNPLAFVWQLMAFAMLTAPQDGLLYVTADEAAATQAAPPPNPSQFFGAGAAAALL
jgi:hypothetical protein